MTKKKHKINQQVKAQSIKWQIYDGYMTFIIYISLSLLVFLLLMGTGCNKLVKIQEERKVDRGAVNRQLKSVQSMEEMIVPKTFNWNTARRIRMGVEIRNKSGGIATGVHMTVYYKDSVKKELHQMVNGITDELGKVETTYNLPTYVRTVFIKTNQSGEKVYEVPVNSYSFDYTLRL